MALLLRQAIDAGAPPSLARLPMTPEEVAASYDDLEAREGDGPQETDKPGKANDARATDEPGENHLPKR